MKRPYRKTPVRYQPMRRYRRRGGYNGYRGPRGIGRSIRVRLVIGLLVAGFAIFQYYARGQHNSVTGETQRLAGLLPEHEIALGLQAAPEMVQQHGGLHTDAELRTMVSRIGNEIVMQSDAARTEYPFEFHLLAEPDMVNAFALPGGQIFITGGLLARLRTEGEIAGVLGHEIAHVVARHSAEHMAKAKLTQGLTSAAVMTTVDPSNPLSRQSGALYELVGRVVNMKFGRSDEIESDRWGIRFMVQAGYDPRALLGVMEVLEAASGGKGQAEFFSTHPSPKRRVERIREVIDELFPQGVPEGLIP